jgi:RNA polymerase sigma-70 factor, ECF subfamily
MTFASARPVDPDDLIARIRAGDERAYEQLFDEYYRKLCRYAARISPAGGSAEEAVQEVFLKLWLRRDRLPPVLMLNSYLYTAVRNQCLNQMTREGYEDAWRQRRTVELQAAPPSAPGADEDVRAAELRVAIDEALAKLPPRCRQAFLLQRREHMTVQQIAAAMQIAPKTVEVQIGNALKALRQSLAEWFERD